MRNETLDRIAAKADEIESEMKRIHYWHEKRPPAEAFDYSVAFCAATMSFEQWLQFVFLERVRSCIENRGGFPEGKGYLATAACRLFDGRDEAYDLIALLGQMDRMVEEAAREPR